MKEDVKMVRRCILTSQMQSNNKQWNRLETYLVIVAILDLSSRCAASIADTIAPSKAERSHISSVTKNFLARLKNAEGPFDTLTAIVCRGLSV